MILFLFIQALLTLFISGGFFFNQPKFQTRTIALYFLLFSIEIFYFIHGNTGIRDIFPEILGRFYFSIGVLYGPLLFLHFQSVTSKSRTFIKFDLLHLIPLVALNIFMYDIITMSTIERVGYFNNGENFYNCILNLNYFRAAHQLFYGVLLFLFYKKNAPKLKVNQKFYLGGIAIIYLLTTMVISWFTQFANSWNDFSWYYVICNTFVLLIGYILYQDPKFFKTLKAKYQNSTLSENDMTSIKAQIEDLFISEQTYLDNELTLDKLSVRLSLKSHHISQTLSYLSKDNFNDFINAFRVEHAKQLMKNVGYNHYKIEAIALESGFNNKVTFYKAFSKFANTTPSKFRKKVLNA
ncbi:helix-turn-helix domain-containing protein [Croceitalea rosinachiae]|uniref:Helix-turn-helix domain-containing protein n=1 Tax=Croceitalea rosinachiae TaxID=3075596 RepID=A0ABU3AEM4_9FLAO|nr:helix-turn-helix domain-containing protein [Croceitalea sp. F388]MDT0608255.1 helix-turn-helix domain-containing protein [Croceitalea sp. F388]